MVNHSALWCFIVHRGASNGNMVESIDCCFMHHLFTGILIVNSFLLLCGAVAHYLFTPAHILYHHCTPQHNITLSSKQHTLTSHTVVSISHITLRSRMQYPHPTQVSQHHPPHTGVTTSSTRYRGYNILRSTQGSQHPPHGTGVTTSFTRHRGLNIPT